MKRVWGMKQVGFCLVVVAGVAMLAGLAQADPVGTASVFQFVQAKVFPADETAQQSFRTTDVIGFRADYFDPNPACAGVAPVLAQLFLFTAEGLFVQQFSASNGVGLSGGPKYRGVFKSFASAASIPAAPGSYTAAFLVRDCTNTNSIVLAPFLTFRVVAP
jgi:hypothetical protein